MNQDTSDTLTEEQRARLRQLFCSVQITPDMPTGKVRFPNEPNIEPLPVDEFLSKAERLAIAKDLQEEVAAAKRRREEAAREAERRQRGW